MADKSGKTGERVSRREFLGRAGKTVGAAAALPLLSGSPLAQAAGGPGAKSKVVLVKHPKVIDASGKVQASLVGEMLARAMRGLTGKTKPAEAWAPFIQGGRPVGIKLNTLGLGELAGSDMVQHFRAVTDALVEQLGQAGVAEKEIIVWDRSDRELVDAGLALQKDPGKLRCMGVKADRVGDAREEEYHPKVYSVGDKRVRLCRLLSDQCQSLINVPLLKHHRTTMTTGALKNHFGSIDKPQQFHCCDCVTPGIPELNTLDPIQKKQRLVVADCLMGLYDGGPWWDRARSWPFGGILVGTDPVAVDAVMSRLLDEKRKTEHLKPLTRHNKQLALSAKLGVGNSDPDQIDLQTIELG